MLLNARGQFGPYNWFAPHRISILAPFQWVAVGRDPSTSQPYFSWIAVASPDRWPKVITLLKQQHTIGRGIYCWFERRYFSTSTLLFRSLNGTDTTPQSQVHFRGSRPHYCEAEVFESCKRLSPSYSSSAKPSLKTATRTGFLFSATIEATVANIPDR